ncbi:MAG: MFS transporter [Bacteriovoracaceae bacterium]|nr:MFS transporter [Bacteriovoracaceae bacterium]
MVRHYKLHFSQLPTNLKLFLLGHALMAFGNSVHGLLFNLFLREAGLKEGVMGSLASTTSLGTALMAFPAAFILEKFPVKPLLMLGLVVSTSSYIFQVLSPSVDLYTMFGLIGAMGLAIFNISIAPFIFRHTQPEQRVYAFTINAAVVMGSQLVGYLVGGELPGLMQKIFINLSTLDSFRYSMSAALIVTLVSLIPYSRILKAPIPRNSRKILGQIKEKDWRLLGKLIAPKVSLALGAGMIIPFMNVYLSKKFNLGSATIGGYFGALQLFTFAGIFLSPVIVKRVDRLRFMMITSLLSVPFMLTMAFASSVSLVMGSFFMRGMLMNMSGPMTSLFEMERVKETDCLFVSSMLIFCYNSSWTLSSQLGGWVIESYGFQYSFMIAASFYFLAVCCYWMFFRARKIQVASEVIAQEKLAA